MKAKLKGKVALVTGGNSGIGRAIAFALAEAGCRVAITARRQDRNEETAAEIREKTGADVTAIQADVQNEEDCRRAIEQTVSSHGALHILVNNAGIIGGGKVEDTDTATFDRVMKTNVYGPFWCSREAMPRFRKNRVDKETGLRGCIINISSVAGKEAWAGQAAYSSSKFALMALTHALSDEGRDDLVRAVAICPAMVRTPMTGATGDEYLCVEDIAHTVLYLFDLSPAAWPAEIVLPRRGAD